jgi:hypothetical protein
MANGRTTREEWALKIVNFKLLIDEFAVRLEDGERVL